MQYRRVTESKKRISPSSKVMLIVSMTVYDSFVSEILNFPHFHSSFAKRKQNNVHFIVSKHPQTVQEPDVWNIVVSLLVTYPSNSKIILS